MIVIRMQHLVWIVHPDEEYVDRKQYFGKQPIVYRVVKPSKRSAICFTYQSQQYGKNLTKISASIKAIPGTNYGIAQNRHWNVFFVKFNILRVFYKTLSGFSFEFIGFLWHEKVYYHVENVVEHLVYH